MQTEGREKLFSCQCSAESETSQVAPGGSLSQGAECVTELLSVSGPSDERDGQNASST